MLTEIACIVEAMSSVFKCLFWAAFPLLPETLDPELAMAMDTRVIHFQVKLYFFHLFIFSSNLSVAASTYFTASQCI